MPCDLPGCEEPYALTVGLPLEGIGPVHLCSNHDWMEPEAALEAIRTGTIPLPPWA